MKRKGVAQFLTAVVVPVVLVLLPMAAGANDGPPDPTEMFARLDVDNDGILSADEFPGPEELFENLDTDGDGYLSEQEVTAFRPGPPAGAGGFEKDDADHDGQVTFEEFSGPEDLFDRLDADGDGIITRAEARPGPPPGDLPFEAQNGIAE